MEDDLKELERMDSRLSPKDWKCGIACVELLDGADIEYKVKLL